MTAKYAKIWGPSMKTIKEGRMFLLNNVGNLSNSSKDSINIGFLKDGDLEKKVSHLPDLHRL